MRSLGEGRAHTRSRLRGKRKNETALGVGHTRTREVVLRCFGCAIGKDTLRDRPMHASARMMPWRVTTCSALRDSTTAVQRRSQNCIVRNVRRWSRATPLLFHRHCLPLIQGADRKPNQLYDQLFVRCSKVEETLKASSCPYARLYDSQGYGTDPD